MLNCNLNLTLIFIFQEKTIFFLFFCKSILLNLIRIWIRDRGVVSLRLVNTICFIKETALMFSYWLSSSEDSLCILKYSYQSHEFCQKSIYIFTLLITLYSRTAERDWKQIIAVLLSVLSFALICKLNEGSHWYETMPLNGVLTIRTVYRVYRVNSSLLKVKNLSSYCNS